MTSTPRTPLAIRVLAIGAALLYMMWVFSPSQLSPRTSFVSELLVHDQPGSGLLRAADVAAGSLVTIAAVLAWRRRRHVTDVPRWVLTAAILGTAVFGLATIIDALSPLGCTPTASEACRQAERDGSVRLHHQVHSVSSSFAGLGTTVAMVATALVARARAAVLRPWVVRLYVVFAGFFVLVTAWVLVEVALHSGMLPFTGLDALGWSQRLQITSIAAWLAVVAAVPLWERPARRRARTR